MHHIYWFNPESDLALAHGSDNYTPPPFAVQLRRDLQLLPAWLAPVGSMVLVDDAHRATWLAEQGLDVEAITRDELPLLAGDSIYHPWGWSRATRRDLLRMGADERDLPTAEAIDRIHRLSHRRTTIAIHRHVAQRLGHELAPIPVECNTMEHVLDFVAAHPGCYVKAPWSGSGHGIYHVTEHPGREFTQWCAGVIRRQGSVLCEVGLRRVMDFAVECECRQSGAHVTGYSIFETDAHDQYTRGIVAPREDLRTLITTRYPAFDAVEAALVDALSTHIAPHYTGPLGVDMLLYERNAAGEPPSIDPCVELNLRHTMGMVTAALADRHHRRGHFTIVPVNAAIQGHPLTPTLPTTHHTAQLAE